MTSTDKILALAASVAAAPESLAAGVEVTEADLAAFSAAAARGAASEVVRALLAVRPAAPPSGDPAWTAWLTAAAATAAASEVTGHQLRAAIGICATQAAGLAAAEGTRAFAVQVGKASFNGVEAALLARSGFTAPTEPLDGRRGLFALFG